VPWRKILFWTVADLRAPGGYVWRHRRGGGRSCGFRVVADLDPACMVENSMVVAPGVTCWAAGTASSKIDFQG